MRIMKKNVVILGASIAGMNVMNTLVKNNYEGKITLIDKKKTLPYNPYKLSKDWMMDLENTNPPLLKKARYYENHHIDLKLNTEVIDLNIDEKTVVLKDQTAITYDILILALGSKLNKLQETAENLLYLRTFEDALKIKEKLHTAKHITLIGSGFIGLELASSFRQLDKEVTVLMRDQMPLEKVLGKISAKYIMKMHQDKGVKFIKEDTFKNLIKEGNTIIKIETEKGESFSTDLVIAAIGVKVNLMFEDKFEVKDGAIVVNQYHQTSIPDVYAAGDMTVFPYLDQNIHVDHWEVAYTSGINIAKNILSNNSEPYHFIPYFWSDQYDQTFEYLGYAKGYTHAYLRKYDDKKFVVAYTDENQKPLAILFTNHAEKRKDVEKYLESCSKLNPKNFSNSTKTLLE